MHSITWNYKSHVPVGVSASAWGRFGTPTATGESWRNKVSWDCWLCIYLIFQLFLITWNHILGVLEHHCCQPRGQRCSVCPAIRLEALSTVRTCTILSNSQNISKLSIFQGEGSPGLKSDHKQELLPVFSHSAHRRFSTAWSKPGKVWVYSTGARKLLWQTKQVFGQGTAAPYGSSLLTHTALHSNAGTEALGGKKSQQVLISYNLEMSINVSIKFQGV